MSQNRVESPTNQVEDVKMSEISQQIIDKLEAKGKNYQRRINQLQKENIILTNKINDLEDSKKRLRSQKMDYQKELEFTKHKVSSLEKEIQGFEIFQSSTSFSNLPKESPENNLAHIKKKILNYKDKHRQDTDKKEDILNENARLTQMLEMNEAKYDKAQSILHQIEEYEKIQDIQQIEYKKIQAILSGFFNDFEEIRIYQQIGNDIISSNFQSFSDKIRNLDKNIQYFNTETIQSTIMALLDQIEFSIKQSLNFKGCNTDIFEEIQQKDKENEEIKAQIESLNIKLFDLQDERNIFENENNYLKDQLESLAEQYQQDKNNMLKKLTIEQSEEQFQLKSENEKLLKENQFLDEMMSKLVNLMPSVDTQELLKEIIEKARQILQIEKERVYIEQLLEINEQNLKMAIHTLPQDITDEDVCLIRKNVEKYRESLKNCSYQKSMMVQDLTLLLSSLDRAAIIQSYRLQAIRSTEKDEIINQAYVELVQQGQEKQNKKNEQNKSGISQKESQEVVYKSARELLQQKSKREGNPLLNPNKQQSYKNQLLEQENGDEYDVDQKFKASLQNASFTLKSILSNNRSYKEQALMNEKEQKVQKQKDKDVLIGDDEVKDRSLLQKHMLLARNQFITRADNPFNIGLDNSQDQYFSKLDYSKSNATDININQQDQIEEDDIDHNQIQYLDGIENLQ